MLNWDDEVAPALAKAGFARPHRCLCPQRSHS